MASRSQYPTICIRGGYGSRNFGDDALFMACCSIVSRHFPPERVFSSAHDVSYYPHLLGRQDITPRPDVKVDYDFTLYGGGTQFYSFPLTRRTPTLHLWRCVVRAVSSPRRSCRELRRRWPSPHVPKWSFALGVGIGPFCGDIAAEARARNLFQRLDFVSVRDAASLATCRNWGLEKAVLGADLCFLPGLWDDAVSQPGAQGQRVRKVGVIVRDWIHTKEGGAYAAPLREVVGRLPADGSTVQFISFGSQGYGHSADRQGSASALFTTSLPTALPRQRHWMLWWGGNANWRRAWSISLTTC